MKLIPLVLFFLSHVAIAQEIVFPRADDAYNKKQCIVISKPCSFDPNKKCTKQYCGVYIHQNTLDNFVKQYQLVGRKFASLFELEEFLKKRLPPELNTMPIRFVNGGVRKKDFNPGRITVIIDKKDYILQLVIG